MTANHPSFQSPGENLANATSHACGVASILVALPSLLAASHARGGTPAIVGASIFAASALFLYSVSAIYHAAPPGEAKRILRRFDHCAIFLLIAGTYTPFAMGVLRGPWGWSLCVAIWALAATGIVLELRTQGRRERLSLGLYLAMGWLAVIAVDPVLRRVPVPGILLLLGGGLAYTLGTVFYAFDRLPYFHTENLPTRRAWCATIPPRPSRGRDGWAKPWTLAVQMRLRLLAGSLSTSPAFRRPRSARRRMERKPAWQLSPQPLPWTPRRPAPRPS